MELTKAEQKEARKILAELNAASCHLALMLNACLLQWHWGLAGGKPGALEEYPAFPDGAFTAAQKKKLKAQLLTIDRYNFPLLESWGIDGKKNMRNGMHHSVNRKVAIINKALQKYGPPVRIYLDDVIILTAVLARCASGLRDVERHTGNQWRLLCQTIHTLVKRTATPNHLAYAEAIYAVVKPWLMGAKALEDWEENTTTKELA